MTKSLLGLDGKVIVVIGGGGLDAKGIGASNSLMFAAAGAKVVIVDRDADRAEQVAEVIRARGGEALPLTADAADEAGLQAVVEACLTRYGAIDGLVTIIGGGTQGPALALSDEAWDADMALNLKHIWRCCRLFGKAMIDGGRPGSIVAISSIRGFTGSYHQIAYGVAKAGLQSLVRTLAVEWGEHAIRVNAVAPGATATPKLAGQLATNAPLEQKMNSLVPLGRLADPDEMAGAVLFLSSKLASYVTGQTLVVDGGYLLNHAMLMYRDTAWK